MKPRVLFIAPYPYSKAASQRFRFEQYYPYLKQEGIEYDFQPFLDEKAWDFLYKEGLFFKKGIALIKGFLRRIFLLTKLRKYDFIFIHREASPYGPPFFEFLISKVFKKRVIFDFDDAIWLRNFSHSNRFFAPLKSSFKTSKIIGWSYKISCGNEFLKSYALNNNKNTVINPTTIDTDHWHNKIKVFNDDVLTIGWTGTHSTIRYMEMILPVLERLEREGVLYRFLVISDTDPGYTLKNFEFIKWSKKTEIDDLLKIDLGIMPLLDDEWSRGKCGFKALQYMSLGIPSAVSPVGVNTQIVQHKQNGFICTTEEDWYSCIIQLAKNKKELTNLGNKARKTIEDQYSVKSNRANFLSLFS